MLLGKKIHEPDFAKNLKIHKVKGTFDSLPQTPLKPNRVGFDPRAIVFRKAKKLEDFNLSRLREITGGNCGVLLYSPMNTRERSVVTVPDIDISNVHAEEEVITLSESIPSIACNLLPNAYEVFKDKLVSKVKETCNHESIKHITKETKLQRQSNSWFEHRQGRITASRVLETMRKVNDKNEISAKCKSLVGKIFDYVDIPDTKALRWGRAMEEVSVNQYKTLEKKKHAAFELHTTGLHISESNPWIAGSPDSIINCQCCGTGVLEVKNPYKYRDNTIHQIVGCA